MMRNSRGLDHAFTLIEMIGVLAVIAVLAALLIPRLSFIFMTLPMTFL